MSPLRALHQRVDASTILTVYLVVLLAVPAVLGVGALGTAGSPATLVAIAAFMWWLWYHLQRDYRVVTGRQPVRAAVLALMLVILAAYAHAMSSPLPVDELTPADSGVLKLIGLAGVVLVANDGIARFDRHRIVVRRTVIAVGLVAMLGVLQYATGDLFVDRISIPGLSGNVSELTLASRSGLARPSGTSTHPIEFGVVLTMVLPLAIVFATRSPSRRWLYRVLLAAIAFSVFLAISRSAMICACVALVTLAASWSSAARWRALAVMLVLFVSVYLTVPGLLGTLGNLFTGASEDTSIASRTGSYEIAAVFIERNPLLGRGFGTFLPQYWILDNQYLGLLIETGIFGLLTFLVFVGTGALVARRAWKLAEDEFDRQIARALFASITAGAVGLAFFDTLGFPQSAGMLFLLIGLSGASLRLARHPRTRAAATDHEEEAPRFSPSSS
ncbi:O-antigen ligase family protein [Nocardioides sp. LHG3406-4]|uniref:O-antigen ligase family protein n=1 Tax=Nocardioides sp. LHG3406-4 TaxID=2804575 RepID=UPI003CEC7D81